MTSQNREEGGTCARTREAASRAASQGVVAGHGTKVRGWGQDPPRCGYQGGLGGSAGVMFKRQLENGVLRHNRRAQNAVFGRRGGTQGGSRRRLSGLGQDQRGSIRACRQTPAAPPPSRALSRGRGSESGSGAGAGRYDDGYRDRRTDAGSRWQVQGTVGLRENVTVTANNSEHSVFCVGFPENVLMRCWVAG